MRCSDRLRNIVCMISVLLGITLIVAAYCLSLPRTDRYMSVHPASAVPPLMGFSADSVFNTGSADQLDTFPGIGEVLADRIIEGRENFGPYRLPEDLLLVKGIGPKTLSGILAVLSENLVELPPVRE